MFPLRACRFGLVRSRQPFRGDESFPRNPPWLARGLRDVRGHLRFLRPSSRLIPGKIEFSLLRDRDRSQLEIHQPGKLNLRLSPRRRLPFEKCKINKNKNHTLKRHLPVPDLRRSRIPVGFVDWLIDFSSRCYYFFFFRFPSANRSTLYIPVGPKIYSQLRANILAVCSYYDRRS